MCACIATGHVSLNGHSKSAPAYAVQQTFSRLQLLADSSHESHARSRTVVIDGSAS